jgi:hypothetical protein
VFPDSSDVTARSILAGTIVPCKYRNGLSDSIVRSVKPEVACCSRTLSLSTLWLTRCRTLSTSCYAVLLLLLLLLPRLPPAMAIAAGIKATMPSTSSLARLLLVLAVIACPNVCMLAHPRGGSQPESSDDASTLQQQSLADSTLTRHAVAAGNGAICPSGVEPGNYEFAAGKGKNGQGVSYGILRYKLTSWLLWRTRATCCSAWQSLALIRGTRTFQKVSCTAVRACACWCVETACRAACIASVLLFSHCAQLVTPSAGQMLQ